MRFMEPIEVREKTKDVDNIEGSGGYRTRNAR